LKQTILRSGHWVWSLAWLVACGGRQEQPSAAIAADRLADAMAEAFCSSIEGCCGAAGFRYDAAACRRGQTIRLESLLDGPVTASGIRECSAVPCDDGKCARAAPVLASVCAGPM